MLVHDMIVEFEVDQIIETIDTNMLDNDSGEKWSLKLVKQYLTDVEPNAKNIKEILVIV